ncbi:phosphatase PAP2 family protein [Neptunomonas phycophila]|uniref:phosphatase PAP2 family protein n=1 Tax=Neptunomonas phycophila TaxID=1572645 RepID=UPI000948E75F|nr:phosphatase PAP2 family protein [Neptunomonas phycophila]
MLTIQKITDFDTLTFNWLQTRRLTYSHLALISRAISRLGDGLLYVVIGVAFAVFDAEHGQAFLVAGLLAFLVELPVYWLLKNTIKRPRPSSLKGFEAVIVPSDTFSFPSGHSAAAFLFATLLAVFYPALAGVGYVLAGMIGFSRVMLGVHYPTDIAAGAALGICCAELAMLIGFAL